MAKKLSPQGYIYGDQPYSHHPFWEESPDPDPDPPTPDPPTPPTPVVGGLTDVTATIYGMSPDFKSVVLRKVKDEEEENILSMASEDGRPLKFWAGENSLQLGTSYITERDEEGNTEHYTPMGYDGTLTPSPIENYTPLTTDNRWIYWMTEDENKPLLKSKITVYVVNGLLLVTPYETTSLVAGELTVGVNSINVIDTTRFGSDIERKSSVLTPIILNGRTSYKAVNLYVNFGPVGQDTSVLCKATALIKLPQHINVTPFKVKIFSTLQNNEDE